MSSQPSNIFWTKSLSDWDLLDRYRVAGSHAAFAELVARHVGLVHGICRRRLDRAELAEIAARDIFLLLARTGPTRRAGRVLVGWLVAATHQACGNVPLRRESALEAALVALSSGDRDLLLSRYYLGRNLLELSVSLGLSQNAAAKRLSRAVARVRRELALRGVAVADDAAVGAMLSAIGHEPVQRSV